MCTRWGNVFTCTAQANVNVLNLIFFFWSDVSLCVVYVYRRFGSFVLSLSRAVSLSLSLALPLCLLLRAPSLSHRLFLSSLAGLVHTQPQIQTRTHHHVHRTPSTVSYIHSVARLFLLLLFFQWHLCVLRIRIYRRVRRHTATHTEHSIGEITRAKVQASSCLN